MSDEQLNEMNSSASSDVQLLCSSQLFISVRMIISAVHLREFNSRELSINDEISNDECYDLHRAELVKAMNNSDDHHRSRDELINIKRSSSVKLIEVVQFSRMMIIFKSSSLESSSLESCLSTMSCLARLRVTHRRVEFNEMNNSDDHR